MAEAEAALDDFAQAWSEKYPTIVKQWRLKWPDIAAMFDFPPAIRRAIGPVNLFVSAQVGTRFAWSVSADGRQPILKDDREVIQRLSPFGNWQGPLLG